MYYDSFQQIQDLVYIKMYITNTVQNMFYIFVTNRQFVRPKEECYKLSVIA